MREPDLCHVVAPPLPCVVLQPLISLAHELTHVIHMSSTCWPAGQEGTQTWGHTGSDLSLRNLITSGRYKNIKIYEKMFFNISVLTEQNFDETQQGDGNLKFKLRYLPVFRRYHSLLLQIWLGRCQGRNFQTALLCTALAKLKKKKKSFKKPNIKIVMFRMFPLLPSFTFVSTRLADLFSIFFQITISLRDLESFFSSAQIVGWNLFFISGIFGKSLLFEA